MNKFTLGLLLTLGLLTILAAACGGSSPAPAQPTAVPPTNTAPPPTNTPVPTAVPPTDTPASSGNSAPTSGTAAAPNALPTAINLGPGVFTDALNKSKSATVYRVDMQIAGSGTFNPLNAMATPDPNATPTPVSDQLFPLIAMKGEVNGADSHLLMTGLMSAFVGADPNTGMEVTNAGGKTYLHGPASLLGANEAVWYEVPSSQAQEVKMPYTPSSMFDAFSQGGINPNDFKQSGTETLDNHPCTVYQGDQAATLAAFQKVTAASGGTSANFAIDTADFRFWVCDDGYLHQVRLSMDGHQNDKPDVKGTFLMMMHVSDFNGNVPVTAPTGSKPLPPSPFGGGLGAATDTPTPSGGGTGTDTPTP